MPGEGTKIPHATQLGQIFKINKVLQWPLITYTLPHLPRFHLIPEQGTQPHVIRLRPSFQPHPCHFLTLPHSITLNYTQVLKHNLLLHMSGTFQMLSPPITPTFPWSSLPQFSCQHPSAFCDPFLPPTTVFPQHTVYGTSALLHHQVISCERVCN